MRVTVSTTTRIDATCAAATDTARAAAVEVSGDSTGASIGEHLGVTAEAERVVTHRFAANQPGYSGWSWSVTVARAPRSKQVTISEVALLPDSGALLAPDWLPWNQRLRPGDLSVGDLLPTEPDDDRLAPGYLLSDDPAVDEANNELGLGRIRVMSRLGRLDTAERWYSGDAGPTSPMAKVAPANCGTCGFYLPLAGSLSAIFGACGNVYAPDDGRVVSADHGCGAHSEVMTDQPPTPERELVLDEARFDIVEREDDTEFEPREPESEDER